MQRERVITEVNDRLNAQVDRLTTVADGGSDGSRCRRLRDDHGERESATSTTSTPSSEYLKTAVARLVPARNEASVAIIDGAARYRPATLSGFDISGESSS